MSIKQTYTLLCEKKWSGKVKTEWKPKEGFFDQSGDKIASGLKANSKDLKQAMSRLTFYQNRAGKNLGAEDKKRLEAAKTKLRALYGKKESVVKEHDAEIKKLNERAEQIENQLDNPHLDDNKRDALETKYYGIKDEIKKLSAK